MNHRGNNMATYWPSWSSRGRRRSSWELDCMTAASPIVIDIPAFHLSPAAFIMTVEEERCPAPQPDPKYAVFHTTELLSIICSELSHSAQASLPKSCHPLCSLALTDKFISSIALDYLWTNITGFRPVICLFPDAFTTNRLRVSYS